MTAGPTRMEPALVPLAAEHVHVAEPEGSGPAALAMAMDALGSPEDGAFVLDHAEAEQGASPYGLALAALRRGYHALLTSSAPQDGPASTAADAGLVTRSRTPRPGDVVAALEAGHPTLVRTDEHLVGRDGRSAPVWVVALRLEPDAVILHVPTLAEGPTPWPIEALDPLLEASEVPALLELAPKMRVDLG